MIRTFFITCMLLTSMVSAQKMGLVHYGQIDSNGLKGPLGPDFNAYMTFNTNESYYVVAKDSLEKGKTFKTRYYSADGSRGISLRGEMTTRYGRQVYRSLTKDSTYWNQWDGLYVAEKLPKINWELMNETKLFGKITARKANGTYRGREYTAWYTMDIPLPFGPWKLHGLPGLILEAYDQDKEIYIYFKSITYPLESNIEISQVKRPDYHPQSWKSLEDFKKRLDRMYEHRKNSSILIAERMGTNVPERQIKREVFIESFDE
ncbi:MAG: GLPGLI family protein [Algicola sp.]|nr:GLPGLI family protein [Algicola sp.]